MTIPHRTIRQCLRLPAVIVAALALIGGVGSDVIAGLPPTAAPPAAGTVDFERDIRPLFARHCHSCHGPEKQKSGLRLDRGRQALEGGDSGEVILPGNSADSVLVHVVSGTDPDLIMPPEDENDRLTAAEIEKLRTWIDAGADWPAAVAAPGDSAAGHWAFELPRRWRAPPVSDKAWVRNPIDAFVLARLEQENIRPSPEADPATLLRRLSLDLLGLLPSRDETAAFIQNFRPDAYERQVDRLLASPHFGERWGRHWLDLARYADSDGYEKDTPRPYAYLFRDWVIDAINRDLPFDQFTIEQLAGDLLPAATDTQQIATGFHRQTLTNLEGGVDQEEFRAKATVDRVDTTGATWLGLTVGCAECHTHKYDPITQREFYQLYAFFNNASEKNIPAPQPTELATYHRQHREWKAETKKLESVFRAYGTRAVGAKLPGWLHDLPRPAARWTVLHPSRILAVNDGDESFVSAAKDGSITPRSRDSVRTQHVIEAPAPPEGTTGFRLETLEDPGRPVGRGNKGDFRLAEFTVRVRMPDGGLRPLALNSARADFALAGTSANAVIDGNPKTGWSIGSDINRRHVMVFPIDGPLHLSKNDTLVFEIEHARPGIMNRFRISATTSTASLEPSILPDEVVAALDTPAANRSDAEQAAIERYFVEQVDETGRRLHRELVAHDANKPKFPETTAAVMTAEERQTRIHLRGDFLNPGDEVEPNALSVLHPFHPRGNRPDRLDLARWIVDPANPLTSRVTVNRVWKNLFGRALVTSTGDFGARGETPSHPQLLDWLAVTFFASPNAQLGLGWSRKALIKLIVTSATYRQASIYRPELHDRDPNNVLLARQNRYRLEAEAVRDVFLAASNQLEPSIGGPSIRPQLPADIAALGYANRVKWKVSEGRERFRRGLYIFFQRTVPYPMLMTFDAPDSNTTCTRRERSNTPLQALTLLNDPVFFECAQALGAQMAHAPVPTDEKIRLVFQTCLSREPKKAEMARLREVFAGHVEMLRQQPENAALIAGVPGTDAADPVEQAALVSLSRVIMNLDEFVTRD